MTKLNLLFITCDFSRYLERNSHYLAKELAKITNLTLWHKKGSIQDILAKLNFRPDFILLNDLRERHCPTITGLESLKLPFGAIMHDLHHHIELRKQFINDNKIPYLFPFYRDAFIQTYPEFISRMHWLPHFVNTHIFKDYGLPKDIDYLMLGCTTRKYYPLRHQMLNTMSFMPGFVYHEHPGYKNFSLHEQGALMIGENYAREINRAKIFLTCDSIYHYPLRKYFEVLACKSLLLAPSSQELSDLGFIPGVHYVAADPAHFKRQAKYYLSHAQEREAIIEQGYAFVRRQHSAVKRADQLVRMIKTLLSNRSLPSA